MVFRPDAESFPEGVTYVLMASVAFALYQRANSAPVGLC